jgi:hypothetical protein
MKKLVLSVAVLALGATGAQAADLIIDSPVIDSTTYAVETPSEFYFSVEALALWRSSTDTELFLNDATVLLTTTRDLAGLGMGYGMRFSAGGPIADQFGWQVAGFWAGNFSSTGASLDPSEDIQAIYAGTATPGNLGFPNSEDSYAMTFTESSSIGGLEASATFELGNDLRFFVGPRWLRYQASLVTAAFDDSTDFAGLDDDIDRVDISSTNDLFGVQLGVEGMVPLFDAVSIGGRAAVGLYANNATLDRTFSADDGETPFILNPESNTSSVVGFAQSLELSPKVAFAVTDGLDISLGATLLYLNGVDEPGTHLTGIGAVGVGGAMAADTPTLTNGVHFAGLTLGLNGRF